MVGVPTPTRRLRPPAPPPRPKSTEASGRNPNGHRRASHEFKRLPAAAQRRRAQTTAKPQACHHCLKAQMGQILSSRRSKHPRIAPPASGAPSLSGNQSSIQPLCRGLEQGASDQSAEPSSSNGAVGATAALTDTSAFNAPAPNPARALVKALKQVTLQRYRSWLMPTQMSCSSDAACGRTRLCSWPAITATAPWH